MQQVAIPSDTAGHKIANVTYTANSIADALAIQDWIYDSYGSTIHVFEITNNSPYTLEIGINDIAKNTAGVPIGAGSTSEYDMCLLDQLFLLSATFQTLLGFQDLILRLRLV